MSKSNGEDLQFMNIEKSVSLRKSLKLLRFNGGLMKFIQWLKDNHYLMNDLEPYSEYYKKGFFTYSHRVINQKVICVTRITIKGLYFIEQQLKK